MILSYLQDKLNKDSEEGKRLRELRSINRGGGKNGVCRYLQRRD